MAALTQVAISSRKAIRYSLYFIVFLTIGRILLIAGIGIYQKMFPSPPPAPTVKFGKLTRISFPQRPPAPKLSFAIETPDGGFPKTPEQLKVYFMPKASSNLLALDTAKEKAKNMGFMPVETAENDSVYKFTNQSYPVTLEMNIITGNFSISYDLASDRTPIDVKPPVAETASSEFKSVLNSAGILPDDMTGPITHDFFKLNNGQLVNSISLSEADLTKISLFRKSFDDIPAVTETPNQGNIWAIVSGSSTKDQQIIAAEYKYYKVDETQASTYPIKSPDQAFSELQSGNYFPASVGSNVDGGSLKIRNIYLAYFDPSIESNFYQPVYVFEGDGNFVGYVPAVTNDYYGK